MVVVHIEIVFATKSVSTIGDSLVLKILFEIARILQVDPKDLNSDETK